MTVVARQPLPPRPSATVLHNRADFLFFPPRLLLLARQRLDLGEV